MQVKGPSVNSGPCCNISKIGDRIMWVIIVYSKDNRTRFEFDTEKEAREAFENIPDYKILTEIIYLHKVVHETVTS